MSVSVTTCTESINKISVAVLEARKLKKMDITGASDPYVKLKLFDSKGKRIGKKKKTSVKSCNLNPYWNESFVFIIDEMDMKRVLLEMTVCRSFLYKFHTFKSAFVSNVKRVAASPLCTALGSSE